LFAFLLASAQLSAQRQIAEPCHLLTVVADDLVDLHFLPLSGAEAAGLCLFPAIINSLIFLLHCGVVFCFSQSRSWYKICCTRPAEPCGVGVVLNNLSAQVGGCLQHAEDCARKATAQTDPQLKQDYLDLERRWLFLARSYEFTERLTDFSDETKRQSPKI